MSGMGASRWRIVAVNAMVLVTMGLLLANRNSDRELPWWLWLALFAPPILAILSAFLVNDHGARRAGYIAAAILMLPAVAFGVFGGWGLLYAIAIAFLMIGSLEKDIRT